MIVNIQKAIDLTGLSRSTIQRHIKQGKLSRTDKGIDTSELIRVYGELKPVNEPVKANQTDSAMSSREQFLISQIDLLTKQLDLANERERRLMALIEHQTGIEKDKPNAGVFFSRLFSKK